MLYIFSTYIVYRISYIVYCTCIRILYVYCRYIVYYNGSIILYYLDYVINSTKSKNKFHSLNNLLILSSPIWKFNLPSFPSWFFNNSLLLSHGDSKILHIIQYPLVALHDPIPFLFSCFSTFLIFYTSQFFLNIPYLPYFSYLHRHHLITYVYSCIYLVLLFNYTPFIL